MLLLLLGQCILADTYRPVIILGPLSEFVIDKLCVDFPEDFAVLQESQKKCAKEEMELALQNNTIADYKLRSNGVFEYTSMQAVRDNKVGGAGWQHRGSEGGCIL